MSKKPAKTPGNPYKILYWMGALVAVLAIGVVLLIRFAPHKTGPAPDPERTMVWLYDSTAPAGPAQIVLIEESRSRGRLAAVALAAPADIRQAYGGSHALTAQQQLAAQLGRQVHHRVFLPYSVVSTLVDAAQGINVDGRTLNGPDAVKFIQDDGDQAPDRAARVMLALAQGVNQRGVSLSTSQALGLARSVDTDIDLTAIADVLGRWSQYPNPTVQATAPGAAPAAAQPLLLPDAR